MDAELFAREVGRLVRERRKALGMTQDMLARVAGVSRRSIVSLEIGETPGIRLNLLVGVFDALGMTMSVSNKEDEESTDQSRNDCPLMGRKHIADKRESYASAFERVVENLGRPVV